MTLGDQPAFPGIQQTPFKPGYMDNQTAIPGMTYRMWLVGQIVSGLNANPESWNLTHEKIAEASIGGADAIIKRLEEEGK